MSLQPGQLVSLINSSIPLAVESIDGDDVTVIVQHPNGKRSREQYKAVVLRPFQRPRPITFRL